jgi:P22 coat protein - gene protein 5
MANTTLTASVIAKASLAILENELGVIKTLYRAHEEEFDKTVNGYKVGQTVTIRRPDDGAVRVGQVSVPTDVVEGSVTLSVDQFIGTDFQFSSTDLTMNIGELSERVIKPRMSNIINYMAKDVLTQMYRGAYNWVGTPGTVFSGMPSFSRAALRMDQMSIPSDMRYSCLNPDDKWGMIGAQSSLYIQGAANDAYRRGEIGPVGDIDTMMSQVTPSHITGSRASGTVNGAAQNVTYDTVKNTWSQSLTVTGVTGIANAGDVFTILGVNMVNPKTGDDTGIPQQFVVTTTTGAAPTSLTISPPIILTKPHATVAAAPANGATITWLGAASTTFKQSLFYHKNAMALAVVPLEIPPGSVGGARESYKGISVRVIPYYDGINDVAKWRLDLLYGRKLIDPRLAVRASG